MKLSELKAGQGKVDVEFRVKSKSDPRVMNKYGKELKVCNAVVEDETGEVKLTLWNDDVDKVNVGDKAKITNGYVSEFNGEKQLTSGKFGKLEILNSSSAASESKKTDKKGKKDMESEEAHSDYEEKEF